MRFEPIVEQLIPIPSTYLQAFTAPLAPRSAVEAIIEGLIEALDCADGDLDLEDGDVDCCAALDDDPSSQCTYSTDYGPGDPDDAEDDDGMPPSSHHFGVIRLSG